LIIYSRIRLVGSLNAMVIRACESEILVDLRGLGSKHRIEGS